MAGGRFGNRIQLDHLVDGGYRGESGVGAGIRGGRGRAGGEQEKGIRGAFEAQGVSLTGGVEDGGRGAVIEVQADRQETG